MEGHAVALPRILALAAVLPLGAACSGTEPGGPTSAVVITFDTTRADALGCYGGRSGVTPNLDALAAESILFERAYTVAPLTLPAHATLWTGLYPLRHGVRENGLVPLTPMATTLAETARANGFQTAAFVAAVVLDATFGLDQGFEVYSSPARPETAETSHYAERPAGEVVDEALAWLRRRDRARPFLLWVHVFEPHSPYEPPPDLRGGALADAPYLGEVAAADREIGRLLDALRAEEAFDRTAILVIADHGEALGEHGEPSHAAYCYESVLRVPLLLRLPGGERAGERSTTLAGIVDALPTLTDALGLAPLPDTDGTSLLRDVPPGRGLYFESYSAYLTFGWSPLTGWIDGDGKYLHSSAPELYDVAVDPGESSNLVGERSGDAERYRAAIAELAAKSKLEALSGDAVGNALREELRGLGYGAPGAEAEELPHPLAPTELPAPAQMAESYAETLRGLALLNEGLTDEAEAVFRRELERHPGNWLALDRLAVCLMRSGRHLEAIAPLRRLTAERQLRAAAHHNLGECLRKAGRVDEAIAAYWRAVELDPGERIFMDVLMRTMRELDRREEANAMVERYRELLDARRAGAD